MTARRILLVYDNLAIGGVQTLIVRLAEHLRTAGREVAVLVRRAGDAELESAARRQGRLAAGSFRRGGRRGFFANPRVAPEAVLAFDPLSLTGAVARFGPPGVRLGVWVLHPREFAVRRAQSRYRDRAGAALLGELPAGNVAFMNEACAREHGTTLGWSGRPLRVVPLPVDTRRYRGAPAPVWGRLVTVGRLVPFKTYHRWMLPVIAALRNAGAPVTYEVYGEGPERPALREQIEALGLADSVRLHGAVPWSALPAVFAGAWGFAGMGTSLVEAAAAGVPALVTPESSREPLTYGFFHESPGFEVGEYEPGRAGGAPAARLTEILDPAVHRRMAEACRAKAEEFAGERVWPQVVEWIDQLAPARVRLPAGYALRDLAESAAYGLLRHLGFDSRDAGRYVR